MKLWQQTSTFDSRITLLHFEGELNAEDCAATSQVFSETLESKRFFLIALMENVTFISSPFVGELMGCRRRLVKHGGDLVIVGLPYSLRENLELMGADKIFRIYPDTHMAYTQYQWAYKQSPQVTRIDAPAKMSIVPALRRFVSRIASQKGFTLKEAFRVETIVDEIANNAIEHGDPAQATITLEVHIDKHRVEILIKNRTQREKADKLKEIITTRLEPSANTESRGRGLRLIKKLSDSIDLAIDQRGTTVKVIKLREDA